MMTRLRTRKTKQTPPVEATPEPVDQPKAESEPATKPITPTTPQKSWVEKLHPALQFLLGAAIFACFLFFMGYITGYTLGGWQTGVQMGLENAAIPFVAMARISSTIANFVGASEAERTMEKMICSFALTQGHCRL